jgi:3-isopropylmalate dehydrogenase
MEGDGIGPEITAATLAVLRAADRSANPASLIGSAAMLLSWLGERRGDRRLLRAAAAIDDALERAIATPQWRTADLGGPLGTKAFGERVAALMEEVAAVR